MLLNDARRSHAPMTENTRKAMSQGIRTLLTFALTVVTLVAVQPVEAQNVATTGQIRGRIVNPTGEAVSQVVVTARNLDTGLQRTALSNNEGLYAVRLLPPGRYSVTTQVIGFADATIESVTVAIGQVASANFVLETQAIELQGLEVTADRARIDASDGSVTQLVTVEQIEELPSLGRDFVDFIELSGLVAPDPGETTGGQFAIGGQRPSGTNVQIDGVDANNSFFGENRGGSRIPFVFSLESIEQFQIITNGFDVEYGSYSGGIVNVVTRGGTNEFEGTVYGNFRSDALTGSNFVTGEDVGDYEVQQFAARLSGPIVEDEAHFLVSVDGQRRREPQRPLSLSQVEDPAARAAMERYFQILETEYGVSNPSAGYQPFETTNDAITLFGRIDWSINQDHRLTLRHNYSDFTNGNEWSPIFDFEYGRSRAEDFEDTSHSFVGELQSLLGDNTFNVLRFQWADEKRPRQGHDLRPTLTVNIDELSTGEIRYGGSFAAFNNRLEETKLQLINNFTHIVGDHTLKVGGNLLRTSVLNQFQNPGSRNQGAGEFVFEDLDAFEAGQPTSYFRPFQQGGGISLAEFDVVEWSVYAQDEWQVTPKLTATLGLRYDQQSFQDSPSPVVDVERAFGFQTGFAPTDGDNISPRLALAYDINGDGNHVARFGAGYFYGRVPYVLGGNVFQTQIPGVEIFCNGDPGDPNAPPGNLEDVWETWARDGSDNPTACAGQGGLAAPVPTYSLWTEDFQYPETFKANLGYEGLLNERTRVSVDVLFTEGQNQFSVRNINLRPEQFQIAGEGRRVYTPLDVFNPSEEDDENARINREFADVFAIYNDGRNRAFTLNVEGAYNFSADYRVTGSYTFTRAYDNVSASCCLSSSIFGDPTVGAYGPNDIGGAGDFDKAWGRSDFGRDHTIIFSGFARLPYDFEVSAFWRLQSGRPWTPETQGDLNGDGVRFNDRPFIFSPADLPLAATGEAADEQRALYASYLSEHPCVGDYEGRFIERNTCEFPWTNRLDMKITKSFDTFSGQRAEIQLDLFNVMNGVGQLLCSDEGSTEGTCGWGRITGIFGADRNLFEVAGFDAAEEKILYEVADNFFTEDVLGSNLLLQFQAQVGFRYYF